MDGLVAVELYKIFSLYFDKYIYVNFIHVNILQPKYRNNMNNKCVKCKCNLNEFTQVCYGYRNGKPRIRNICKQCRSKESMQWANKHREKRNAYIRKYIRKIGRVKEHPCLSCGKLCEKVYAHAFCSVLCRFMKYVEKSGGCWIWTGGRNRSGYGKFSINGKLIIASRAAYTLFKGPVNDNKLICHTCDNPPCVNPAHLWEGTNKENQLDSIKKGRHKSFKK